MCVRPIRRIGVSILGTIAALRERVGPGTTFNHLDKDLCLSASLSSLDLPPLKPLA